MVKTGLLFLLCCLLFGFAVTGQNDVSQRYGQVDKAEALKKLKEAGMSDQDIQRLMLMQMNNERRRDTLPKAEDYLRVPEKDTLEYAVPGGPGGRTKEGFQEDIEDTNVVFGHHIFGKTALKYYDKTRILNAPEDYIVGPGDEIGVSVWGFSDFSGTFRVQEDGYIENRIIGRIYVKGQTFGNVRKAIAKKFGVRLDLTNSEIAVTLSSSRMINVNIVGEVENPGTFTIPAINSAFMALVAAGGPGMRGSVRNILVRRSGVAIDTLDLYRFLMDPGSEKAIYLSENDYLLVPVAGPLVKVEGEVRRPFTFEMKGTESLETLIRFAGGFTASAYRTVLTLIRIENNREVLISIPMDSLKAAGAQFEMKDGDRLVVSKIQEGHINSVKAIGAFKIPGEYEVRKGDKISDLLQRTDGLHEDAYRERAYLVRLEEDFTRTYFSVNLMEILNDPGNSQDNIPLQGRDELIVLSKIDFEDDFQVEVFGAVRKSGKFVFGSGLSLKDVIFLSGGLKNEAASNRIEVFRVVDYKTEGNTLIPIKAVVHTLEVPSNLSLASAEGDFNLQPFDQIYVRTNPDFEPAKNIVISGEVFFPGTYGLLRKDETVAELIARAGGLRDYAFTDGVTMDREIDSLGSVYLDLDLALKRPKSRFNLVLHEGDSIHIPKTMDLIQVSGYLGNNSDKAISAPYFGRRANYYVRKFAGGFNEDSYRRQTFVFYPNGIIRKPINFGLFKIYPKVRRGSRIVVNRKPGRIKTEKEPVDWNRVIENFTIKATGVLTLWILADRVAAK